MPRYEIHDGDNIRVTFGVTDDDASRVFLSVYDNRIKYDPYASAGVNKVAECIQCSGDGCFLDLHTGSNGFGHRVDDDTMATYLRRYGVTEDQIGFLPLHLKDKKRPESDFCNVCGKKTTKKCSKCKDVHYCLQNCQKDVWLIHKVFCGIEIVPSLATTDTMTAKALLLTADNAIPQLVEIPIIGSAPGEVPASIEFSDVSTITDTHIARFEDAESVSFSDVDTALDLSSYLEGGP